MTEENISIGCVIVEDEPLALQLMEKYVKQTDFLRLEASFLSATALLEKLKDGLMPELIFSDIQMPQVTGLELAQSIPQSCHIIFTTAYGQYALDGFKVNAVDYLVKPISYEDFLSAAQKAARLIYNEKMAAAPKAAAPGKTIRIKSDRKTYLLNTDDIQHIEGMKDFVKIYLSDHSCILSLIRLKSILAMLPAKDFMAVHKSHIVRLGAIRSFDGHQLDVDGTTVPVGRLFSNKVMNELKK